MRRIVLLMIACFIVPPLGVALAQVGNLTLPIKPGDAVMLTLPDVVDDRQGSDVLRVFVGPPKACCVGKTPIAGTYETSDSQIIFRPTFEFITGQVYTVQHVDKETSLSKFKIATEGSSLIPKVVEIFPSGPEIPENTLRFYIQFSMPMMPHRANEFITLVDAHNNPDLSAFMSFTQELWNQDRTQLTLLMDPGRIKRGVAQNRTLGPALVEGQHYSIVVKDGWPGAIGAKTAARFQHAFTVSAALRELPDITLWTVRPPRLSTKEPLVVTFDRPFDQQGAQSAIVILDADGQRVSGSQGLENHQRSWRFVPDKVWSTPRLEIVVDARLEDVAGNNFNDLLDHKLGTQKPRKDHQTLIVDLLRGLKNSAD